jgi:hypothetical protein
MLIDKDVGIEVLKGTKEEISKIIGKDVSNTVEFFTDGTKDFYIFSDHKDALAIISERIYRNFSYRKFLTNDNIKFLITKKDNMSLSKILNYRKTRKQEVYKSLRELRSKILNEIKDIPNHEKLFKLLFQKFKINLVDKLYDIVFLAESENHYLFEANRFSGNYWIILDNEKIVHEFQIDEKELDNPEDFLIKYLSRKLI